MPRSPTPPSHRYVHRSCPVHETGQIRSRRSLAIRRGRIQSPQDQVGENFARHKVASQSRSVQINPRRIVKARTSPIDPSRRRFDLATFYPGGRKDPATSFPSRLVGKLRFNFGPVPACNEAIAHQLINLSRDDGQLQFDENAEPFPLRFVVPHQTTLNLPT